MAFDMDGAAYDRFMGRYSEPLADSFVARVGPGPGDRALDVGCGPGALTARLVARLDASSVSAIDPSPTFLASLGQRFPEVDARRATADRLPFDDDAFDVVAAQLVVHFMPDPVAGLAEMRRVTTPGGRIAACTWDLVGERAPISPLWRAARDVDPGVRGEELRPGTTGGDLTALAAEAGLTEVEETELAVSVEHPTFEEWWEPYLLGVGPAGDYVTGLPEEARSALRDRCRALLGEPPYEITAVAWTVRGRA